MSYEFIIPSYAQESDVALPGFRRSPGGRRPKLDRSPKPVLPEGSPRIFSKVPRPSFQPTPLPVENPPIPMQRPAIGSLGYRMPTNVPVPEARPEQESGWKRALRGFAKMTQTEGYKQLTDFLIGAGQASPGGGFGESLQKGALRMSEGIAERQKENKTVNMFLRQGFSQEEAEGMAANPDIIKDVLQYSSKQQQLSAASKPVNIDYAKGVINTIDERGVPLQLPIKGSAGYELLIADRNKANMATDYYKTTDSQLNNAINQISALIKSSGFATGSMFTPISRLFSGSAAAQVKAFQDALKANLALTQITRLRDMSPTGAHGLGQLTEKEYEGLASAAGALSQDLTAEQYLKQLQTIRNEWNKFYGAQNDRNEGLKRHLDNRIRLSDNYGAAAAQQTRQVAQQSVQQVQQMTQPAQQMGAMTQPAQQAPQAQQIAQQAQQAQQTEQPTIAQSHIITRNGVEYLVSQERGIELPIMDSLEQAGQLPSGTQYILRGTGAIFTRG